MAFVPPSPFVSNPLKTREQVASFLTALLDGLEGHTSPGGARIHLGYSGTHYDEIAAQLEGFSRPLWGLASLVAGGSSYAGLDRWIHGLAHGADPQSDEFWGWMTDKDQRMVECSAIGYLLGLTGEKGPVWEGLGEEGRTALGEWLGGMNDKTMPNTNWLWFRVFANLGLHKVNSPRYDADQMLADLDHLDTFYLGSGWSRDGPEGVVQLDYYSSSFAIQVAQLLYSRLAEDVDPVRCREFRQRATMFALDFVHYFDEEGRAIPFGRSMCYRSAMAAFWAAFAFAFGKEALLPSPWTWGTVKGLLLRNLRYWASQPGAYAPARPPSPIPSHYQARYILTLGYTYPNQSILENYNSPGSTYWACKAFICLALPDSHPFWTSEEELYPMALITDASLKPTTTIRTDPDSPSSPVALTKILRHPLHLMVHATIPLTTGGFATHTYLLSSGQQCSYAVKQSASKYGKLSYSSAFGYSVPVGGAGSGGAFISAAKVQSTPTAGTIQSMGKAKGGAAGAAGTGGALEELGGDSTLAVSDDGGETWKTRRVTLNARFESSGDGFTWLRSSWKPWPDIEIETWLLPPRNGTAEGAGWYLRIHRIRRVEDGNRKGRREILTAEGGWAIYGQGKDARALVPVSSGKDDEDVGLYLSDVDGEDVVARASTKVGVSGIVDVPVSTFSTLDVTSLHKVERTPQAIRMDANSNLIFPRAVLPALRGAHTFEEGESVDKEEWIATGVFGLSKPNSHKDSRDEEGLRGWGQEWANWKTLGERVPKEILHVMKK